MKRTIHFTKMHGAGNDYIYINTLLYNIDGPSELARLWSDRHKGIGSDGLVLIGRSPIPEADFSMRIFNADGSEAMMCGNACRCIGKYLYEKGLADKTEIRLLTPSGLKVLMLKLTSTSIVETVTVDMGEPVFDNEVQFSPTKKMLPEGIFVSMGNPHYVIFTDDVDAVNDKGRELEYHPAFPERDDGMWHRSLCRGCGCNEDRTRRQDEPHHHGRRHARSRMARARQSCLSYWSCRICV